MPRSSLLRSDHHPYHITSRCNNKEFFTLPLPVVWSIMMKRLKETHQKHDLAIHAFVLMGNHFHLLCHTPRSNIDTCMHFFLRSTSLDINRSSKTINHLWGGRYRWTLIDSQRYYFQVYRYLFQNPLRAGIVSKVEDYPYSTLKGEMPFPLHSFVPLSFGGHEGELLWLNQRFEDEDQELIRLGLRRTQFDLNKKKLKAFERLSPPPKGT
jgi:putative transposase